MADMPAKLDKRLILAEWMLSQFGFASSQTGMKELSGILRDQKVGWDEQNVFYFRRRLEISLPENRSVSDDQLVQYDRNVFDHWRKVVRRRQVVEHRDLFPLYFQYIALLFSEHYLDRWSHDRQQGSDSLLTEINQFRESFNARFTGRNANRDHVDEFTAGDLTKLAFWIATGGGKTLIMHCNILQLEHYLKQRSLRKHFNKYILITPNEGLSGQHIDEFKMSDGFKAGRYEKDKAQQAMSYGDIEVEVIEITKLEEKSGVTTVAVSEFGKNNIVLVDEGHRELGGDKWFAKRQQLCSEGFSLEYSATFGQTVNSLATAKQKTMGQMYAKSVLIDYSYKYFYADGYGKDFNILNYSHENKTAGDEIQKLYLTACLLRFYQQCRLFADKKGKYASYLLDDPLMVFVGGSVTGKRQKQEDTDVVAAIRFFAEFISDEQNTVRRIDLLLRNKDELKDEEGLVFRDAFKYCRDLFSITNKGSAQKLFDDLLEVVFRASGKGLLQAVHLKGSNGELGLRVGEGGEYFGVINVGEGKKLWDLIAEKEDESIVCQEHPFSDSLFDDIKKPGSKIRVLIGAKKFTEGWSCWRVSCMGLINIGKKEGSQIIQLFGRGVRLKGLNFCLKRSSELSKVEHPEHVGEMETLNIFGIKADYMDEFDQYIEEEDVTSSKKTIKIILPTIENLARTDLKVILPKKTMPNFKEEERPVFTRETKIRTKVSSDWYGRLDSRSSRYKLHADGEEKLNCTHLKPIHRSFLDFQRIYFDILAFKKQNAMYNLEISLESIRDLLAQNDWYDLFIPEHMLEFTSFSRVKLWEEIATDLLKKYCQKFYNFQRDKFEAPYQEYRTIQQVLDDPEDRHNKQFLQNLRVEYLAAVDKSEDQLVKDLKKIEKKLGEGKLAEYDASDLKIFNFDRHLYQPLIFKGRGGLQISVKPTTLNKNESQFLDDLKAWCINEEHEFLADKELYVLRNQSRGRGISFFEEGGFYPDFILWLIIDDQQYITFVDPHGLLRSRIFSDAKVQFSRKIKEIQKDRFNDPDVHLNSFILSPTPFSTISASEEDVSKDKFTDLHVLFMYDDEDTYVQHLFELMTNSTKQTLESS